MNTYGRFLRGRSEEQPSIRPDKKEGKRGDTSCSAKWPGGKVPNTLGLLKKGEETAIGGEQLYIGAKRGRTTERRNLSSRLSKRVRRTIRTEGGAP